MTSFGYVTVRVMSLKIYHIDALARCTIKLNRSRNNNECVIEGIDIKK